MNCKGPKQPDCQAQVLSWRSPVN
ncbi:hypothetical protein U0070_012201 [Myodes glareolus]|uniref:Uncharacterized protein n=1 Tax=Myodes glareolus TaxID=447135 RepID=A0AAW0I4K2_MYOGA